VRRCGTPIRNGSSLTDFAWWMWCFTWLVGGPATLVGQFVLISRVDGWRRSEELILFGSSSHGAM
jgi:hypothetical protein